METIKKILKGTLKIFKWLFISILLLIGLSALYNISLPKSSKTIDILSKKEKAMIAEAMNLQRKLGKEVFPEWGDSITPIIVYNEKYAFLTGYSNPPSGWLKMPNREFRGKEWEKVPDDDFYGVPYYRQSLSDPNINPENFAVMVGDRWVATIQTKEYAAVEFYNGFRNELPPVVNLIFPYRTFWNMIMGTAEQYIAATLHESFHAFQGIKNFEKFADAESVARLEDEYPWFQSSNAEGWREEINLLVKACVTDDKKVLSESISQFVEMRRQRRENVSLSNELALYEQQREWLEGLAKYAELTIGLKANQSQQYDSFEAIRIFPDFKDYKNFEKYYTRQLHEAGRAASHDNENRFYFTGFLQALVLDRMMPDWKNEAFHNDAFLDDLLEKAVKNSSTFNLNS